MLTADERSDHFLAQTPDDVAADLLGGHEASIVGNHDLHHYVRGAAAADASTDPSVQAQLASLRAQGFLGSRGTASSRIFQVTR